MDNMDSTKIAGAVLAALLLIFGPKAFIEMRAENKPVKVGYTLPGSEAPAAKTEDAAAAKPAEGTDKAPADKKDVAAAPAADAKPEAGAAPAAAAGGSEIVALLASASADNGKAGFKKCSGCHQVEKGKAGGVGPNLWGIVNRPKAAQEGFAYSEAIKAKGGEWSFENLSAFLKNPKGYVAGTKMAFAGIKDPQEEADVIAYLATLADTPVPLPK